MANLTEKGKAALKLIAAGWHVFPLIENDKAPAVKGWESIASDDPITVAEWWTERDYNIGLATGPSGLVVLDFDSAKGPNESSGIENFRKAYKQKLTNTFTVRTPSGGWHLYYEAGDLALRNTASKLADRVDTRAQGGYVVAPGSMIDGQLYQTMTDVRVPVRLPGWIVTALQESAAPERTAAKPKGDSTRYAQAALKDECRRVQEENEGGRNHATNRAAWNVSRFVAKGELDYEEARSAIVESSMATGLSKREASHATASGLQRGISYYGRS